MYWNVEHLLVCEMCLACLKHLYDIALLLIVIVLSVSYLYLFSCSTKGG